MNNANKKSTETNNIPKLSELIKTTSPEKDIDDSEPLDVTITEEDKKESRDNSTSLEILAIWKQEKNTERWMKIAFSAVVGAILVSQIYYIDTLMNNIGTQKMAFDEWTIKLFITGVFIEIIGLVKIVAENLFPKDGNKNFMQFIEEMYSKNRKSESGQADKNKPS